MKFPFYKDKRVPDKWLILGVITLSLFGVLMVYDSSVAIAIRDFSDQYYYVREQFKWLVVGIVVFAAASKASTAGGIHWHFRSCLQLSFCSLRYLFPDLVYVPSALIDG
jgi:cell division protein FtsW (lipid II flippase)